MKLRIPEEGTFTADAVKGSGREGKSGYGRQMALNTNQYKAAASRDDDTKVLSVPSYTWAFLFLLTLWNAVVRVCTKTF